MVRENHRAHDCRGAGDDHARDAGLGVLRSTPTGSGTFVHVPPGGPAGGTGSIQLIVGAPDGELFATTVFGGIRVDRLTGITNGTYMLASAIPETANLQFDFDTGPARDCSTVRFRTDFPAPYS